jgi:putative addiction module component (TIGR02574 family)
MHTWLSSLGIDRLGYKDRLQLAHEILDSLQVKDEETTITDEQREELDRRIAAIDAKLASFRPWEEVEASVLERLRR